MDLLASARAAGLTGQSWHDWVMSDETQDAIVAIEHWTRAQQDAVEKAFQEGRRERSLTHGRVVWTTASRDYDGAGATELETFADYYGKTLRKVSIEPEDYQWQMGRYTSGIDGVWEKDPIEEDRRAREKRAQHDAEMAASKAKREAGAAWLRTATAAELANEDLCWERGATYTDVRAEQERRHAATQDETRQAGLARIEAAVPEGATLIDEGAYIPAPGVGMRPIHRPARVYFNIHLVHGWPDDAEHARIEHDVGRSKETLPAEWVVDLLAKGQLRVAQSGEVPPGPVVDRIGVDRWKDIRRVEVAGRVVWVGRAMFGSEDMVLDEQGKLVRAKKIVEAAKAVMAGPVKNANRARATRVRPHPRRTRSGVTRVREHNRRL